MDLCPVIVAEFSVGLSYGIFVKKLWRDFVWVKLMNFFVQKLWRDFLLVYLMDLCFVIVARFPVGLAYELFCSEIVAGFSVIPAATTR